MININRSKYFFLALFIVLIYLSYRIVRPVLTPIIIAALLAYIFKPVYKILYKKTKRKNLSSFILTIFVIIVITLPSVFILNSIIREAAVSSVVIKQRIVSGNILGVKCTDKDNFMCGMSKYVKKVTSDPETRYFIDSTIKDISDSITKSITNLIIAFPRRILDIAILFFVMFYLFRDGGAFIKKIRGLLPIKEKYKKEIFEQMNEVTFAVINGYIIVGVIQGILGSFIFFALGVSSPILWGIMIMLLSILPFIGPTLIWVPGSLFLFLSGYVDGNTSTALKGIILLLCGLFVFSPIDNILKPKIIGNKTEIHPAVIIIGLIGGMFLFGFVGFLLGPLTLTLLVTIINIYEKEKLLFEAD